MFGSCIEKGKQFMGPRPVFLPIITAVIGIAIAGPGLARSEEAPQLDHRAYPAALLAQTTTMPGHTTAPSGAPVTGSQQGPGRPTGPGSMVTSPSNVVPSTGSEAGAEPANSMPPGHMAADPNGPATRTQQERADSMVGSSPNSVPTTGSAAGAESVNSMPLGHMAADPNKK